jgi:hypothetical protein
MHWHHVEITNHPSCVCFSPSLFPAGSLSGPLGPGSKYAYFMYSSNDRVEHILHIHRRVPITVRGQSLRIERTVNCPYGLSRGPSAENAPELGKPLDPATSTAIVEELKRTVPGWRGSYEPSRVLWIGRLPTNISRTALTNFWSRLGCVVEVRPCTCQAFLPFSNSSY